MWANRKYPRTACMEVFTDHDISPDSPRWRMYSSTCARWIPTSGSSSLGSHQQNQRLSWEAYSVWV